MRVRTPIDLGAVIRDRRTKLDLDQKALADMVGVSRQWIVAMEKGKPRAEIGLVLRALAALGIDLDANYHVGSKTQPGPSPVDIDSIVSAAREKKR
jgi:HTH-type transcriptional regulator / antitoxin HipB